MVDTTLVIFIAGFISTAIFCASIFTPAQSISRAFCMLVGLVAIGATEFYVVGIALPRTSVTSEHIYIMSTFFAQSEVMALCLGLGSAVILSGLMVMVPKN